MKQMKLKWLLQEMSGHINHAMLRTVVFSSGSVAAALVFWAGRFLWLPCAGKGCALALPCLHPRVSRASLSSCPLSSGT